MISLPNNYRAIVFGATGGIGNAFCTHLEADARCEKLVRLSRSTTPSIDFADESSLEQAAATLADDGPFHLMIDATGILSDAVMQPEKALRDITPENLQKSYLVNAVGPILLLKHFHNLFPREGKSVFASLSAKVGSIGDNQIGGWYSYRASKAALNMLFKNASIELGRKYTELVVLSLHPGTVDTGLSRDFSSNIKHEIFSPEHATQMLLEVIDRAGPAKTGTLLNYQGDVLPW